MKKLFYRLLGLAALIAITQIILFRYIIAPIPEITLLNKYLQSRYNIIYFGDSVIDFTDETDTDKASIADMLARRNRDYAIADFSHGANQPEVYRAALDYISRAPSKPEGVIIAINLASFSPVWNMTPGLQFEKQKFFLMVKSPFISYFYRPLAILGAINVNTISEREYIETPVWRGNTMVGTVRDFTDEKKFAATTPDNIRDTFIARYMYRLEENHRKLTALKDTVDLANRAGIKVYAYITPINYRNGVRYVGPDFLTQTRANSETVCAAVREKKAPCLNLAFGLDSVYFNYNRGYATEHLKEGGRAFISERMREFFPKK